MHRGVLADVAQCRSKPIQKVNEIDAVKKAECRPNHLMNMCEIRKRMGVRKKRACRATGEVIRRSKPVEI